MNNEGADQPANLNSVISVIVIHSIRALLLSSLVHSNPLDHNGICSRCNLKHTIKPELIPYFSTQYRMCRCCLNTYNTFLIGNSDNKLEICPLILI